MKLERIKNPAVRERFSHLYEFARERREKVAQLRVEGWTYKQIAEAEGVTTQRIIAMMKRYLEDHPKTKAESED